VTERWSLLLVLGQLLVAHAVCLALSSTGVVLAAPPTFSARAMRDVEAGDLDRRVPMDTNDEVGPPVHTAFNEC